MSETALEIRELRKRFGRRVALDGVTLRVPRGTVLGLVGSNGAGKTTSLTITAGLLRADGGTVDLLGAGAFSPSLHGGRVALLPQDAAMPSQGGVREVLVFYGLLQGAGAAEARRLADGALDRLNLADRAASRIRTLSHGMRRRLALAQCLLGKPELVLLDEPLSGLDPRERTRVRELLQNRPPKQTVVISSHNLDEIERLCDRVAFIERGRTVRQSTVEGVTGSGSIARYACDTDTFPIDELRRRLPGVDFRTAEDNSCLVCRGGPHTAGIAEINRAVLATLLAAGIDIREVRRGEGLETAYLSQDEHDDRP